jgi:gluconate 5-dehydrogenase
VSTRDLFDLTGKRALVTGASAGGLGLHSAVALAELGATVWIADAPHTDVPLAETAGALEALGGLAGSSTFDVRSERDVEAMVAAATVAGPLDILVHHVGVNLRKGAWETSLEEWHHVLEVNITGTWLTARAAARSMAGHGGGRIVTTGSIYTSVVGPIPESAYYASKAGVSNLTRGLAMEWAAHGITVNCLAPGVFYPTRMTAALAADPERLRAMEQRTMLGRLGDPSTDLKGAVAFLASDASAYMTGQTLFVDGGWTAW